VLSDTGKSGRDYHRGRASGGAGELWRVVKRVCLDYVPEVEVGDYTIVHVGFALSKIDEETAEKTLEDFREMGMLEEELAERGRGVCAGGGCAAVLSRWELPVNPQRQPSIKSPSRKNKNAARVGHPNGSCSDK
jgi:hydrogenase assembly chaperone HypC/HupF